MKDLITSIACIAILLAFVLQFAQNQVIYNHIVFIDQEVSAFKEVLKQEGKITSENETRLRTNISMHIGCEIGEISVSGTRDNVNRGGQINYRVAVPVKGIIGAPEFWKISKNENKINYVISRYITSEHIDNCQEGGDK